MLKKDKLLIVFFLLQLISCNRNNKIIQGKPFEPDKEIFKANKLSKNEYLKIYKLIEDTNRVHLKNDLYGINKFGYTNIIDSVFCINNRKDKIIGIQLHFDGYQKKYFSDGFCEYLGAKIKGKWYFWSGGYTVIPREMAKKKNLETPLSYNQLHKLAIGSLYGCLNQDEKLKKMWFESHFKGPGWGYFKDRYEYKSNLDGNRIDNEVDYWNYKWKRKGLSLWISKFSNDSILKRESQIGRKLDTEEQNGIRRFISSKMVLEK